MFLNYLLAIICCLLMPIVSAAEIFEKISRGEVSSILAQCPEMPRPILVLEDQSIWEIVRPPYNSQTWRQWLRGQKSEQPDCRFYFKLANWQPAHPMQVYEWQWNENGEGLAFFALNRSLLNHYPYLIENLATGEMVFARPIDAAALIHFFSDYAKEEYERGYMHGLGARH